MSETDESQRTESTEPAKGPVPGTIYTPSHGHGELHLFPAGRSANPGGRARNIERLARALSGDGEDCVLLWRRMLDGKEPGTAGAKGLKWRAWASQRLAERGFGKPATPIDVTTTRETVTVNERRMTLLLKTFSDEELEAFQKFSQRFRRLVETGNAALEIRWAV